VNINTPERQEWLERTKALATAHFDNGAQLEACFESENLRPALKEGGSHMVYRNTMGEGRSCGAPGAARGRRDGLGTGDRCKREGGFRAALFLLRRLRCVRSRLP
jgi:hypothetical protein